MTSPVRITYDPEGDILFVTFGSPTPSTGSQLCDQLLLRLHPDSRQPTGLTIFNFSIHARSHAPISLPGIGGTEISGVDIVAILTSPPISRFLRLSQDETGAHATILQPALSEAVAA
jgi:hypothetical protein